MAGFYRNIDTVTSDQGGEIDAGSLWHLNNYNFFILQDDDEYHSLKFNDMFFEKVE